MSAADAAAKQVGDQLNLNGENVRVTLVQTSEVYRIEGSPRTKICASAAWRIISTRKLAASCKSSVGRAMKWNITMASHCRTARWNRHLICRRCQRAVPAVRAITAVLAATRGGSENKSDVWNYILIAGIGVIVLIIFLGYGCHSGLIRREAAPVQKISAAAPPFAIGTTIQRNGTNFQITTHALMEIDAVGTIYERHEYTLLDDNGHFALLVTGENPGAKSWTFYTPLDPLVPPTITESAARKIGDVVNVDGITATVSQLFQSNIRSVDNATLTDWRAGDVSFNYVARSENNLLLARWNNSGIRFYHGKTVSPQEFKTVAFGK